MNKNTSMKETQIPSSTTNPFIFKAKVNFGYNDHLWVRTLWSSKMFAMQNYIKLTLRKNFAQKTLGTLWRARIWSKNWTHIKKEFLRFGMWKIVRLIALRYWYNVEGVFSIYCSGDFVTPSSINVSEVTVLFIFYTWKFATLWQMTHAKSAYRAKPLPSLHSCFYLQVIIIPMTGALKNYFYCVQWIQTQIYGQSCRSTSKEPSKRHELVFHNWSLLQ